MTKKIDIGQDAKVCIRWNVSPTNYSREQEKSIIQLMAKKYGIPAKNIKVETNYVINQGTGEALASDAVHNIHDPKFQQELFKQFIKENNIQDVNFDEIVKIDSQINSLIDYNSYEKSKRYSIKWVKWSNFLSYGPDNYFDFTTLNGLVLLNGQPANKSGKTTFAYDLLHFLLFGKTSSDKAKTFGQMFNNYLPEAKTVNVEGCINIDGENFVIKRTLTRTNKAKASSKVEFYKLLDNGTEELLPDENQQAESSTATSKVIKEALGNESDFDLIISANSKDLDSLISLTETERGRLLSRWIGLKVIEDKDIKAREKWNKEINVGRYSDMYDRVSLANDIESLTNNNTENASAIEKDKAEIEKLDKELSDFGIQRDALLSSKRSIDDSLLKIDVNTLQTSINDIVEKGKNKNLELEYNQNELKNIGNVDYSEENYKAMKKENEKLLNDMAEIRISIKNLKINNESLSKAEYCPTCKRKLDGVDNSETISKNNAEIEKLTENGIAMKKRSDELVAEMNSIEEKRVLYTKKSQIELKIATIGSDIMSLRLDYKDKSALLGEIKKNKDAIEENNKIDIALNLIDVNIRNAENRKKTCQLNISECEKTILRNNESIALKKSYIVRIDEERKTEKNWKLYLQMIGKDGISKMVLRNTLPIINGELSHLLSDVTDFDVEITMNEKNDIDFNLIRDGIVTRLSSASGLERTQAALALRVVLGKMSNLSKPPFIFLDEILGTVDREFYDDMKRLYDKIAEYYDFVLHISHLSDIVDWHTGGTITVIKENNISRININS